MNELIKPFKLEHWFIYLFKMQHVSLQETHCHACKYFVAYIRVDTSLAQSELHKHNIILVLIKKRTQGLFNIYCVQPQTRSGCHRGTLGSRTLVYNPITDH